MPLGLAQAAALIERQRLDYGTYLERLRAMRLEEYLAPVEGDRYPHGLAEAVLLSLEDIEASDTTGWCRGVIDLVAVLSDAGVPRAMLRAAAETGALPRDGAPAGMPVVIRQRHGTRLRGFPP
jgi:hypothetical protein